MDHVRNVSSEEQRKFAASAVTAWHRLLWQITSQKYTGPNTKLKKKN